LRALTGVPCFVSDGDGRYIVNGRAAYGSYDPVNILMSCGLVNELTVEYAYGRPAATEDEYEAVREILSADPPTVGLLRTEDVPGFVSLGNRLQAVFAALHQGDMDDAARHLNTLLGIYPAQPHLAKEQGVWRLHHHPVDAGLVSMIGAACAEALASVVGDGLGKRIGVCEASLCDRVFYDESKNASRRFCSTACQNRVKAAAFRRRQAKSS
jgi:hypothetical protein